MFQAFASASHPNMHPLFEKAESVGGIPILMADLDDSTRVIARQLYYMLVLLTRGEALNIVINSGVGEGLLAWKRLTARYEPAVKTRLAGLLMNLLRSSSNSRDSHLLMYFAMMWR